MALDFFAGCAGGAAGVIVGHPLDTVKVRIQTQSPDNIKYRGTFHALSQIVKQESASGLYKGISSPLVGVAGINAIVFGVYGMLRPYVAGSPGHDALWAHFAAGSASGAVQSVVCAPMELVKIRMQTNESQGPRETSMDIMKKIYRTEGGLFRGVYKGWMITLLREIPGFGAYFATYELLTTKTGYDVGTLGMLFAGGMAGVVSWILCFPMDVVKTRIQMHASPKRLGILECTQHILKTEGYKAFFRGMNSSVIRAFPTNAATFTVVNWIIRLTNPKQDDLPNERQEFTYLTKEWDLSKLRPKEIAGIMNQWGVLPNYSYISSRWLFPHSSTAHSGTPETGFSILQNFNASALSAPTSQEKLTKKTSATPLEKLPVELIQYDKTDYELYQPEPNQRESQETSSQAESNSRQTKQESADQSNLQKIANICSCEEEVPHLTASSSQTNFSSREKQTLVVISRAQTNSCAQCSSWPDHEHQDTYPSTFFSRLTNWLSNFSLTPVHFCKCVDNCSCRD